MTTEADAQDVAQRELPRYKCHKEVHALKIASMSRFAGDLEVALDQPADRVRITPEDHGYALFFVKISWMERFHGTDEDLGYYVVYKDGWDSWSPSKAFEEGYDQLA